MYYRRAAPTLLRDNLLKGGVDMADAARRRETAGSAGWAELAGPPNGTLEEGMADTESRLVGGGAKAGPVECTSEVATLGALAV